MTEFWIMLFVVGGVFLLPLIVAIGVTTGYIRSMCSGDGLTIGEDEEGCGEKLGKEKKSERVGDAKIIWVEAEKEDDYLEMERKRVAAEPEKRKEVQL